MIKANHSKSYEWFFGKYINFILKHHFRQISITGHVEHDGSPILVVGNHFSWWDGFFIYYLNHRYFHRKLYVMMLEEQLQKRMFFSRIGAFSIQPGSKSVVESLAYTVEQCKSPSNLVALFPQGEIKSAYTSHFKFEKGLRFILNRSASQLKLVFVASLIDYYSHPKPSLTIAIEEYVDWGTPEIRRVEEAYNDFFRRTAQRQDALYR